ncbi:PHP domain-containing protein [Methanocella arvoryzae]|uniref:Metal-dependent phosphoesterase (PHP family) n=1 Tax=Methanocella arvoryzae (strain DSM 22066 / NBRC 105507 / MRE50) TaxID=351160 RepID=Q0W4C1_METAR|nr:PHP domain-containing protein [Methanocella arvoryzae]CAJ36772.1 putative metal-dependent phosphoesterase (PHP family) [Methanocella arvoryzae MRE50]
MLRFDLHVHSNYSPDGHSSVEEILKAAKARGLDGVAITDHDTTAGGRYALEVVDKVAPGLIVIPGVEISTKAGHLIVLGITEDIPKGMSVKDTIHAARKLGGTIVVPHPDQRMRHGMRIPHDVDAAEVYNSRYLLGLHNFMAGRRVSRRKMSAVAGSDAHSAEMVGNAVTEIDADRNMESVLRGIREGRTRIEVRKTPVRVYLYQIGRGWVRKIRKFARL